MNSKYLMAVKISGESIWATIVHLETQSMKAMAEDHRQGNDEDQISNVGQRNVFLLANTKIWRGAVLCLRFKHAQGSLWVV